MIPVSSVVGADVGPINMECPCRVISFAGYEDGGTLGGELEDSHGNRLRFCLDGRLLVIDSNTMEKDLIAAKAPREFFIGASHPDQTGATPLPVGGEAEKQLLAILDSWVESVLPE